MEILKQLKRKWRFKIIFFFFPFVLLSLVVGATIYQVTFGTRVANQLAAERIVVNMQKAQFQRELNSGLLDLEDLLQEDSLLRIRQIPSIRALDIKSIERDFLQFAKINERFGHLRFLGANGHELLRIVKGKNGFNILNTNQLKDKSESNFFKAAKKLKAGQVYISSIDHDDDLADGEKLFSTVIRFSTPIFDENSKFIGVVDLDLIGEKIVGMMNYFSSYDQSESILVNQTGSWLKIGSQELGSSFQFPQANDTNPNVRFSESWRKIEESDAGQFESKYGILTYSTIYPVDLFGEYGYLRVDQGTHSSFMWKIVSYVPNSSFYADRLRWVLLNGLFLVGLFIGFFIFLLSYSKIQIQKRLTEIEVLRRSVALSKVNKELNILNEQMNNFVGIVAHDLRNPLGAIIGFSEILLKRIPEEHRKLLKMINDVANSSLELVGDILQISALRAGKVQANKTLFDFSSIINRIEVELHYLIEGKNITVKKNYDDKVTVFADKKLLGQLIANLVSNAIKFSNLDETIEVNHTRQRDGDYIQVVDHGVGMSPETLIKLCNPNTHFSSPGTEGEKGTGFGIPFCREVLATHGSKLIITSVHGKGSIFSFLLPSS